uniref:Uncharacterized protein n=1 Tax=Eutreptiella gymnastica TaxID=73025 RepID=A0A7S4CLZ1_9EUGL|mmetsp:Transcript_46127/g.77603  ORF Transcript_46127/g.77603 Transcript_46127/m.77603 type:complete len:128 (+) Transcript_46127:29-412(+)
MAVPENLIVNLTFNPPELSILGSIKQGTLDKLMEKLQAHLPQATSSSPGQKSVLEFTYSDSPPHWYAKLPSAYCNEELGQSQFMLIIIDALEHGSEVGGSDWKLKASDAHNHDDSKVTYKFFFVQKV